MSLTVLAPRILVPTPRAGGGGERQGPPISQERQMLKPETLGDVRGIFQDLKQFQADVTAFAW